MEQHGDSISEVTGQEARDIILQFAGQTFGAQKELAKQIIGPSANLTAGSLDVSKITNIVNGIPMNPRDQRSAPVTVQPQPVPTIPVQITTPNVPIPQPQLQVEMKSNKDQLELNFTYDIAKDIVDRLDRVEALLKKVLEGQKDLKKNHRNQASQG